MYVHNSNGECMSNQFLISKLTELEESVRVNKTAILNIMQNKDTLDGDKRELIKSITIPLIINNKAIIAELEASYTKANL